MLAFLLIVHARCMFSKGSIEQSTRQVSRLEFMQAKHGKIALRMQASDGETVREGKIMEDVVHEHKTNSEMKVIFSVMY